MIFALGVAVGILLPIVSVLVWWYRDAGLVTGILDDDVVMQQPASDWKDIYDGEG